MQRKPQQEPPKLEAVNDLTFDRLRPHEYKSSQNMIIEDSSLAYSNALIQLGMLTVIGYLVMIDKTYLETDTLVGSSILSIEGSAFAELIEFSMGDMVFDKYDLRIPEQEKNGIFVPSRIIGYEKQGINPDGESEYKCLDPSSRCPCTKDSFSNYGKLTGVCSQGRCEMTGWCPNEPVEGPHYNYII